MKVILKEDVQNLGQQGDVVEVKPGYARNYLMPRNLLFCLLSNRRRALKKLKELKKEN